jgi:hypothetical protein
VPWLGETEVRSVSQSLPAAFERPLLSLTHSQPWANLSCVNSSLTTHDEMPKGDVSVEGLPQTDFRCVQGRYHQVA